MEIFFKYCFGFPVPETIYKVKLFLKLNPKSQDFGKTSIDLLVFQYVN